MKLAKTVCVFLLSIFILTNSISAYALDLTYDNSTEVVVLIKCESPPVGLKITKEEQLLKLEVDLPYRILTICKGLNEDSDVLLIKCTLKDTGRITTLSSDNYALIRKLGKHVDLDRWNEKYRDFFFSSLNLLDSWPSNLPVFIEKDSEETTYIDSGNRSRTISNPLHPRRKRHVVPDGKTLEPCPSKHDSLCDYRSKYIYGHILCFGDITWTIYEGLLQEWWTEGFYNYVGYQEETKVYIGDCRGRCGVGCSDHYGGEEIYTQRCFNHDNCVLQYGYFAKNCNAMFTVCAIDYYSAPDCGDYRWWD